MPTANPLADIDQLTVPSPAYPAKVKQLSAPVAAVPTDVAVFGFADKIVVTISQGGRLGMWFQVPLDPTSPAHGNLLPMPAEDELLPLPHLAPQPLLGVGTSGRQTAGQLLAAQIASSISAARPDESRNILVGLGLEREELTREAYVDLVEMIGRCL